MNTYYCLNCSRIFDSKDKKPTCPSCKIKTYGIKHIIKSIINIHDIKALLGIAFIAIMIAFCFIGIIATYLYLIE